MYRTHTHQQINYLFVYINLIFQRNSLKCNADNGEQKRVRQK